jgi:Tol biopolymer transport system component
MKKTKKISSIFFFTTIILLILFVDLSSQQTAEELFEKALYMEEAQGDLQKAIGLYEQILKQFPENRKIAAKAQLHIGLCYEKLGLQEAPKAFQKVLDDFPEQKETVKVAQEKLSILRKAQSVIAKTEKEFNIRKVWSGPLTDVLGAPSPDGRYLSFVDWMTGDLAIRDLSTGENRRLTNKGSWQESRELALFSKWSPDGKKIVYNWLNKEELFDLRIVGLDSPKPQILYSVKEKEYAHPFGWSPDGKSILAACTGQKSMQLGLISVADGSFHILLEDISNREWAGYPPVITFSPDGKYLAYDYPQDEDIQKRDIYIISVEDKIETPLISHPMNEMLLGWAPDGKWIFFASDRTGTLDAWIVRVDKGELKQSSEMIKRDLGLIQPLGFTQNGSFFYGISNRMIDIYTTSIDPDTGEILSPAKKVTQRFEGSNRSPAYSSDGKYLAYISVRGPGPLRRNILCIRDIQTGKERDINPELNSFDYPRWSPDSRYISVEVEDKGGHFGIYRIDVQTGAVDPIVQVDPGIRIYSHRWSKDGKTIFYTRSDPDAKGLRDLMSSSIYVHDIVKGEEKVLSGSPNDAKDIDMSPDGQWLALLNRDEKRVLRVIPTSGGEPQAIYSFEHQGNPIISPTWIGGGKYILFYQEKPDSDEAVTTCELVRIPAEGGEPQRLGLVMTEFRHFSVHPDGQKIVFHSMGSKMRWPEVWVMENFLPKEK